MSCSTFNTDEKTTSSELISDFDCSICYELLHEPVVGTSLQPSADSEHQTCLGTCGHDFCKYCYDQWIYGKRSPPCPICKKPLPKDLGICFRLRNTINKLFPDKAVERSRQVTELRLENMRTTKKKKEMPSPNHYLNPLMVAHVRRMQTLQLRTQRTMEEQERIGWERAQNVLRWVHIQDPLRNSPSEVQPPVPPVIGRPVTLETTRFPSGASFQPMSVHFVETTSESRGNVEANMYPNPNPSSEAVPFILASGRPFFTMGIRCTPQRRLPYSIRRRLRQVPTRFGPEFRLPPTTIPPMTDIREI